MEWPHDLTAEERALGLTGMREKYISSALSELGDVTDPNWPPPEVLKKYDQMNRSDFWRSRGASSEAVALLSLGGIDDRLETWAALFMLRNHGLNQKLSSTTRSEAEQIFCQKRSRPDYPRRFTTPHPSSKSSNMRGASQPGFFRRARFMR